MFIDEPEISSDQPLAHILREIFLSSMTFIIAQVCSLPVDLYECVPPRE